MTNSQPAVRTGHQQPRIERVPTGVTSAGDEIVELARLADLILDPWQEYVVSHAGREREDGKWSAFEVGLIVARQNGKNAILEARELAGALLFGEKTIVHSAHEAATALDAFTKLKHRIQSTPALLKRIRGYRPTVTDLDSLPGFRLSNQDRGFEFSNGAKISYKTRTAGSGRGLTGDLVILDEAYALTSEQMDALMPTMAAKSMHGNPQIWYTSSAGMLTSEVLAALRERGTSGEGANRLAYFEWSAHEKAQADDVDAWYQANPALGIRITEEHVRDEYAAFIGANNKHGFERERLSIWETPENSRFITEDILNATLAPAEQVEDVEILAFGVDISPMRDVASIALAGFMPDGRVGVTLVDQREGTSWLPHRLGELRTEWEPVAIAGLGSSAVEDLLPQFRRASVKCRILSWKKYAQASARLYESLVEQQVLHSGQEQVLTAFENVTSRSGNKDGLWVWSRREKYEDITPVVAITLAVEALMGKGKKKLEGKKLGGRVVTFGG